MNVVIKLDMAEPQELGRTYVEGGLVNVDLDALVGPAGHPVYSVEGHAGAVLAWLLEDYSKDDLQGALEIMATATVAGE